jgi:hypothetical protein
MASGHVNRLLHFNFACGGQYLGASSIRILQGILQFAFMTWPRSCFRRCCSTSNWRFSFMLSPFQVLQSPSWRSCRFVRDTCRELLPRHALSDP